jgi:hydrophobe/amphiphile efflux-3 (HAE3) family protein
MWHTIARIILRNRAAILILVGVVTLFMGYQASQVEVRYDFASLLPSDDADLMDYNAFKQQFGEDGAMLVLGVQQPDFFTLDVFNAWYDMGLELKALEGIEEVVSVARCMQVTRNDSLQRFDFNQLVSERPTSQAQVDSIRAKLMALPFYKDILWNEDEMAFVMAVTMSPAFLDSKKRLALSEEVKQIGLAYEPALEAEVHFSGLPYIRSVIAQVVQAELRMFIFLAGGMAAFIMLLFFRSVKVVVFSLLVVTIAVIWCFGIVQLLGYRLSILTGLIPPVLIVIGIANCIFLLNKYHQEFRAHGNKIKALQRVIAKVGNATLLTNATTAAGFATFAILKSELMREFGIVAAISIMGVFVLALALVPIIFSYLNRPKHRHIKHLDRNSSKATIKHIVNIVLHHRAKVYGIAGALLLFGIIGISMIRTTGNLVDDLPANDPVLADLRFFEEHFDGVMPFEVRIDTKKPEKAVSAATLRRIEQLQDTLSTYPEFGRAISMVEVVKSIKQAYYGGMESKYALPTTSERNFILSYGEGEKTGTGLLHSFLDSARQTTRLSVQMKDVGTEEMARLLSEIRPKVDSIFNPEDFDVLITGTSVIFLKGTEYLVNNLFTSLAFAVLIIAIMMAWMFRSWRMVVVSLIPNILPLIITAALMGYLGIAIKPSTILVFSIAFGISVDDTIHFLAKYRQELDRTGWRIQQAVVLALREVGISMIYTSVVLFFGFSIFMASTFGGTKALGLLVSVTLFVAMFSNLFILPALLLTFERALTTESFKDAALDESAGIEQLKTDKLNA